MESKSNHISLTEATKRTLRAYPVIREQMMYVKQRMLDNEAELYGLGVSGGSNTNALGSFNPHAKEDQIIRFLQRRENLQIQYDRYLNYLEWVNKAIEQLPPVDAMLIEALFFTPYGRKSHAIRICCETCYADRSTLYRHVEKTVQQLSKILFPKKFTDSLKIGELWRLFETK